MAPVALPNIFRMAPRSGLTASRASLVILAALGCLSALGADHLDPRTGVPIRCELDASMFPASWLEPAINARAVPLDPAEAARSQRAAERALALYPVELVKKNLRSVYFVKEMRFYGLQYGGTNSADTVFIANAGEKLGYSDDFVTGAFHHEFSSILLRNFSSKFDERAWRAANRPGAEYRQGGTEALKTGTAETKYSDRFNVDGFLNQYGTSSVEEDFNTYAEAIFTGDRDFWSLTERFPRVAAKKDLIVAFYGKLDPAFNEPFFRSLVRQ